MGLVVAAGPSPRPGPRAALSAAGSLGFRRRLSARNQPGLWQRALAVPRGMLTPPCSRPVAFGGTGKALGPGAGRGNGVPCTPRFAQHPARGSRCGQSFGQCPAQLCKARPWGTHFL